MTLRDTIVISGGNLRRMKLRTFLTTSGVLIAIAAFVAMLSFGAGNQQNIEREFNKLGLFSTMQVFPRGSRGGEEVPGSPALDAGALDRLAQIPGVNLVYPYDALTIDVRLGDSTVSSHAQALPAAAARTRLFSDLLAGIPFDSNSSSQVIVSDELLKKLGVSRPDSALGLSLIVSVRVSTIDSGLAHILLDRGESLFDRLQRIHVDSLLNNKYRSKVIRTEADEMVRRFLNGILNAREVVRDTLVVCGVRQAGRVGRIRTEQVIIPVGTAARFSRGVLGGSPTEMAAALSGGTLFSRVDDPSGKKFSQVTLDFDPKVPYKSIRDSVESMGFRTFSFAAEFEQIQRFFVYFDLGLGVIGLIALLTASLGIVNTMVMSINERKREIGILKSLGADEVDIRALFLVESGVIGFMGTLGGILAGWVITRIISAIGQAYMKSEGIPVMDLFALPAWLFFLALGVGIGVSVAAGYYPAARAARVDPVEALRND